MKQCAQLESNQATCAKNDSNDKKYLLQKFLHTRIEKTFHKKKHNRNHFIKFISINKFSKILRKVPKKLPHRILQENYYFIKHSEKFIS